MVPGESGGRGDSAGLMKRNDCEPSGQDITAIFEKGIRRGRTKLPEEKLDILSSGSGTSDRGWNRARDVDLKSAGN